MAKSASIEIEDYTIGRGGIKLPVFDFWDNETAQQGVNVHRWFSWLARMNNPEEPERDFSKSKPAFQPFAYEFIVPPNRSKPLAIVRGGFVPRDSAEIDRDRVSLRDRGTPTYSAHYKFSSGNHIDSVAVAPKTAGSFEDILTVKTEALHIGGLILGQSRPTPRSDVYWQGEHTHQSHMEMDSIDSDRLAFAEHLKGLLSQTIELLS